MTEFNESEENYDDEPDWVIRMPCPICPRIVVEIENPVMENEDADNPDALIYYHYIPDIVNACVHHLITEHGGEHGEDVNEHIKQLIRRRRTSAQN